MQKPCWVDPFGQTKSPEFSTFREFDGGRGTTAQRQQGGCCYRAGGNRRAFGAPENKFELFAVFHTAKFYAYCTEESFGVRLSQHWKMHSQTITSCRCHSRRDPLYLWVHAYK